MNHEGRNIFQNGHLFLWESDDLKLAEKSISPNEVTSLRLGAKCYSSIGLESICKRLSIYSNIQSIEVADDRIPDQEMNNVQKTFETIFPQAVSRWSYDLLVSGKHGR